MGQLSRGFGIKTELRGPYVRAEGGSGDESFSFSIAGGKRHGSSVHHASAQDHTTRGDAMYV